VLPEHHVNEDSKYIFKSGVGRLVSRRSRKSCGRWCPPTTDNGGCRHAGCSSVSSAIFLILELDRPFEGLLAIAELDR
jgi:hypothetical protein